MEHTRLGEYFTPDAVYEETNRGIRYVGRSSIGDPEYVGDMMPMSLQDKIDLFRRYADKNNLVKHMVRITDVAHVQGGNMPLDVQNIIDIGSERWIHVHRPDLLDQFLSYCLAERSNVWHRGKQDILTFKKDIEPFEVDIGSAKLWRQHRLSCDVIVSHLTDLGILIGRIRYSDLRADCEALAAPILDHLGSKDPSILNKWHDQTSNQWWTDIDDTTAKLWTKEEKLSIIQNHRQLEDIFADL